MRRKCQGGKENDIFVCSLFLIPRKYVLPVTKAWLSCQTRPLQRPPGNTSELIPSKAQSPEIERGPLPSHGPGAARGP